MPIWPMAVPTSACVVVRALFRLPVVPMSVKRLAFGVQVVVTASLLALLFHKFDWTSRRAECPSVCWTPRSRSGPGARFASPGRLQAGHLRAGRSPALSRMSPRREIPEAASWSCASIPKRGGHGAGSAAESSGVSHMTKGKRRVRGSRDGKRADVVSTELLRARGTV